MNAVEFRNRIIDLYDKDEHFVTWVCQELDKWAIQHQGALERARGNDKLASEFGSTDDYIAWLDANRKKTQPPEPILSLRRLPLPKKRRLSPGEQAVLIACFFNLNSEGRPALRASTRVANMFFEIECLDVEFKHLKSISDATFDWIWKSLPLRFRCHLSEPFNECESIIIQTLLKSGDLKGEDLAFKAGYGYDGHFKATLSSLRKRGVIDNRRNRGYFLK